MTQNHGNAGRMSMSPSDERGPDLRHVLVLRPDSEPSQPQVRVAFLFGLGHTHAPTEIRRLCSDDSLVTRG